jgi:hypothetical protein
MKKRLKVAYPLGSALGSTVADALTQILYSLKRFQYKYTTILN